jgi:hypothetical protein
MIGLRFLDGKIFFPIDILAIKLQTHVFQSVDRVLKIQNNFDKVRDFMFQKYGRDFKFEKLRESSKNFLRGSSVVAKDFSFYQIKNKKTKFEKVSI